MGDGLCRGGLGTLPLLLWVRLSLARGNAAPEVDLVENRIVSEVPKNLWSPLVTRGFSFFARLETRMRPTNDLNVIDAQPLRSPDGLKADLPITPDAAELVYRTREEIRDVLRGRDSRLLVVV